MVRTLPLRPVGGVHEERHACNGGVQVAELHHGATSEAGNSSADTASRSIPPYRTVECGKQVNLQSERGLKLPPKASNDTRLSFRILILVKIHGNCRFWHDALDGTSCHNVTVGFHRLAFQRDRRWLLRQGSVEEVSDFLARHFPHL